LKFRVKQTNFNGNSNINSNRVMYCGSYCMGDRGRITEQSSVCLQVSVADWNDKYHLSLIDSRDGIVL